ncbi:hypothetical protein ACHAXA_009842 [Cyclostephanos tholiformis]|uniref:DM2 domain-containing protein n=1 Tax=Cyclostephanos tholiformis TaxID=382380 RepID=A0ABD3RAL9_9STRA
MSSSNDIMTQSSIHPSSRMDQIYARTRSILRRLDDLESRLSSRVSAHRRRAANLLEETPASRRSHMRALLHSSAAHHAAAAAATATVEAKKPPNAKQPRRGIRKWILVVEGGLLIEQLDHDSAREVDARLDAGLPILGCRGNDDGADELTRNKAERIPLRDQWRGGATERENERDVEGLQFTHLFDRVEVEMSIVKRSDRSTEAPVESSAITRGGPGFVPDPPPPPAATANVETFTWERAKCGTPDSNAFFVVHNEQSEFIPMGGKVFKSTFKVDHISATVKLYRRQADEGNYLPSPQLCGVFFPTFIGKKAAAAAEAKGRDKSASKSKKRKRSGGEAMSLISLSASSENDASNSSTIAAGNDEGGVVGHQPLSASADSHVPNTLTMDEVLHAIFFYIRTRNLQDVIDLSVVNNNEELANLFGCSRMLFSDVRKLLTEKQLLVKVEPCTHPIILNYDMTLDGAEPLTKKRHVKMSAQKVNELELTMRRRAVNNESDNAQTDAEQLEAEPHQTMLSCDVDIDIPNLFHVRTRDILRRTKYREFEYTSSRIKALRSLMATKVDEETAKQVLGDVVTGKGYAPYHKQALMAMAKGSHPGGEAQRAALIDLRTTSLLEKLEEQSSLARGYWDIVNACQSLCNSK